jgi:uncharacterized membrane protein
MSTALAHAQPGSREVGQQRSWRLGGRARKTILVLHIVAGGSWFGLDVAMAVLIFTAIGTDSAAVRADVLQSLQLVTVWPMFCAAMLSLITGIQLGLGSKYGLVRYWWVAVKLVLNLVLCTLILIALQPGLGDVAQYGRDLAAGTATDRDMSDLFFPPIVSLSALTFATILSVAKPWGRLRKRG